jgi:hypothetical protein
MRRLDLPPGVIVRVEAVGSEGRVVIAPRGVEAEFEPYRRGRMSAIISFDEGADLDRRGAVLINGALAVGEPAFCIFAGGLRDALIFRAGLTIPGDAS